VVLLAILQKIIKVIVIVWYLFECKVFSEGLSHVKDLAILPLILLEQCPVDLVEFWNLSHCSHPNIGISQLISHRIVLDVQRLEIGKGRYLIEDNGPSEIAGLNRKMLQFNESCDILAQLFQRIIVEDKLI
jgi:hypothetical protein